MPGQEGIDWVRAPAAVSDLGLGRKVYGAGDKVPMADAVKYGLVTGPEKPPAKAKPRGKRRTVKGKKGPVEDRARKPSGDRS